MELRVIARTENGNLLVKPELPEGYVALESQDPNQLSSPADWLEMYGRIPLPPYIRDGQMVDSDIERYQTVYAKERGSVAANRWTAFHAILDEEHRSGSGLPSLR